MKNAFERLNEKILEKNSRICAGLDPVFEDIPKSLKEKITKELYPEDINWIGEDFEFLYEEIFSEYCSSYIDAVKDIVPAIKINSAFFEKWGLEDLYWSVAQKSKEAGLFVIGDVKRADIGSTSKAYAEAFLGKESPFDAITINPYFGTDGVMPFLKLAKENGKGVFVIVKTSNRSSYEIQNLELKNGRKVYEEVAERIGDWEKEVDYDALKNRKFPMIGTVVEAANDTEVINIQNRIKGPMFNLFIGYDPRFVTNYTIAINFYGDGIGAVINCSTIMNAYKNYIWEDKFSEEEWEEAAKAEAKRATDEINKVLKWYEKL